MTTAEPLALIDSNVLVYSVDDRFPEKRRRAVEVIQALRADGSGVVSVQVLGEFFNVSRKRLPWISVEQAEAVVLGHTRAWRVLSLDWPIVLEAIGGVRRHRFPYWDALIWATAKLNGVPNVLSEDFSDGALIEGVRFRNPFSQSFSLAGRLRP